jgi:UDP-3-O-[3-hydroxymyristoyl] glucosamine N-acyltransferase
MICDIGALDTAGPGEFSFFGHSQYLNVRLGRHCVICGRIGIAGSTVVGDGVMIGGQVGISDHLHIGSGARIASKSGVIRDVKKGEAIGGYPAMPVREWHKQTATSFRLSQRRLSGGAYRSCDPLSCTK